MDPPPLPSEAVHLDLGLLDDALCDEEFRDVLALVALKLDDSAELLALDQRAVSRETLLERLDHSGEVEVLGQPRDGRQRIPP